jgi:hypothetical protein
MTVAFAAARESGCGTKRQFAAVQRGRPLSEENPTLGCHGRYGRPWLDSPAIEGAAKALGLTSRRHSTSAPTR